MIYLPDKGRSKCVKMCWGLRRYPVSRYAVYNNFIKSIDYNFSTAPIWLLMVPWKFYEHLTKFINVCIVAYLQLNNPNTTDTSRPTTTATAIMMISIVDISRPVSSELSVTASQKNKYSFSSDLLTVFRNITICYYCCWTCWNTTSLCGSLADPELQKRGGKFLPKFLNDLL